MARPRVVVVCTRVPWPLDRGDHLRNHEFLREFAAIADVTLLAFADHDASARFPGSERLARVERVRWTRPHAAMALARAAPGRTPLQVALFASTAMDRVVRRLAGERFDVGVASLLRVLPYLDRLDCGVRVADLHDSMHLRLGRVAAWVPRGLAAIVRAERRRMDAYERAAAARLDELWVTAPPDRDDLLARVPCAPVHVVPNGIDERWHAAGADAAERAPVDPATPEDVLFVGNFEVSHNRDAATWFAREAWPQVRAQRPRARLRLVGRAGPGVRALARRPGVIVDGYVDAVAPLLRGIRVAIAPLRFASGLQNKAIDTMAAGLALVASPLVNEGIGAPPDVLVTAEGPEFVAAIVRLLAEPQAAEAIGRRAREWVSERYRWSVARERLERLLAGGR